MARGRTEQVMATRRIGMEAKRFPDRVLTEEPLEIRLDGHRVATTMRTPGDDFELAVGFCWAEGLLTPDAVKTIRYCGTGSAVETEFNVVTVETESPAVEPPTARLGVTTAACGVCGADAITALAERLTPMGGAAAVPAPDVIAGVDHAVRGAQPLFDQTGAVHGAAAFDLTTGEIRLTREDIGRHNAVDKVVGRLYLDGALPATGYGLFVSGRASFEMVQKAWAAGFVSLVAVGGPSSLAVDTAKQAQLGLVAFARGESHTVYWPDPLR
ncbi:MAG: formate dehydrogenase accessory sulfurtransferase FdhD [Acidimicrobiales bacterium]|nr:formate dehydrogenase accessory sulfurtransferase FdhD [Acidimicrobiales bacterium]